MDGWTYPKVGHGVQDDSRQEDHPPGHVLIQDLSSNKVHGREGPTELLDREQTTGYCKERLGCLLNPISHNRVSSSQGAWFLSFCHYLTYRGLGV